MAKLLHNEFVKVESGFINIVFKCHSFTPKIQNEVINDLNPLRFIYSFILKTQKLFFSCQLIFCVISHGMAQYPSFD